MKKFVFDYIVSSLSLFENSLYNYIAMAVIGFIAFKVAFSIVGKIGLKGELGSLFHWIIRLFLFFLIWFVCFSFIKLIVIFINNWEIILLISLILSVILILRKRYKNKNKLFSSIKEIFEFIVGFVLLLFLIYIGIRIVDSLSVMFMKAITEYTAISVAMITGLLALLSAVVGKIMENKNIINNKIREERQKIYIDFLDWLINNVLYAEISNNKNMVKELRVQQKVITIYASDEVLKAWSDFKISAMKSEKNKEGMSEEEATKYYLENEAPKIEKLILAIRKELGYKNKNIQKYDILKLYLNDIEKYNL